MGLETANFVGNLNSDNPADTDFVFQGDDHIKLIKSTLLASFANILGAVTATQDEINILDGVIATATEINALDGIAAASTIEDRLGVLEADDIIPTGTAMLFYQAAAPVGWTIDLTNNDKMFRVVDNTSPLFTGGATAGTDDFTTVFGGNNTTAGHKLTIGEMPPHTHTHSGLPSQLGVGTGSNQPAGSSGQGTTSSTGGDGAPTPAAEPHTHGLVLDPAYLNIIIATKD